MKIPPMAGINQAMNVEGTIRNKGSQTVTNYDLSYSVNGGTPVVANINGNLASGDFAGTAPTTQYTPTTAGSYTMKVWVSNINGNPDENNANDTIEATFQAAQAEPRNVLAEEFSSSTCPPCKSWNDNVYNAAHVNYNKSGGNTLIVKYQVPIPVAGDPSHNADGDARRAYYGVNSAPSMLINGAILDYSATTWADAAIEYGDREQDGLDEPAFVSITGQVDFTTTATTGDVDASITITPNIDLNSGNHALQIIVLQKDYVFNGATNGDFNYHHVMRKMLPNPNGNTINTTAGQSVTFNETYNFNVVAAPAAASFDLWNHDIEVIAYVEDRSTNTILNAQLINVALIGLDEEANALDVKAYPNPASDVLYVSNEAADNEEVSIELVNSVGQMVFAKTYSANEVIEINTASFDAGVYILNVRSGEQFGSERISVIK